MKDPQDKAISKALKGEYKNVSKAMRLSKFENAKAEHKKGAPYESAFAAIKSKTFSKMHKARKEL